MIRSLAALSIIVMTAGLAGAEPASGRADPAPRLDIDQVLDRLLGHRVAVNRDRTDVRILDVAGQGPAMIGVVERRGDRLLLVDTDGGHHRLAGPLAIPRIAGPGYTVWVLGQVRGGELWVERLGVLAAPGHLR